LRTGVGLIPESLEDGWMVTMNDEGILKLIRRRKSSRVPFDPHRPVGKKDLRRVMEAARWAPTAHNMQNFEILVVDDKALLKRIGDIGSSVSEEFLRENLQQLSFSKEELLRKKVGILGANFPPSWRNPTKLEEAVRESAHQRLSQTINGSPTLLMVVYDSRKRAPASKGDVLGFLSLGCVMENMWLTAESLGIGFQVMSVFSGDEVERSVKQLLSIPEHAKVAYAIRLGYPLHRPAKYLRVRRDVEGMANHNLYGARGLG
jgi:nitroreductase